MNRNFGVSRFVTPLVLILFAVGVGLIQNNYTVLVINTSLMYAIVAYGLSVMLGMGGQLVFSGTAFMGVGAYITANLCSGRLGFTVPTLSALLLSILGAGILSFLTGLLFLRLKSSFCTFATLGFVQVLYSLFQNNEPLFGGTKGIPNISTLSLFGHRITGYKQWFYVFLVAVVLVALIVEGIRHSRLGRSLASIRDNEIAAQVLGVNIYWTRVIAFVIAGVFAGLAGSLLAFQNGFISADLFTFKKSSTLVIMSMLGGINSTLGISVGALIVTFLPEVLRGLDNYLMFIYGFIVIFMMIFMPMGIGGLVSDYLKKLRRRRHLAVAAVSGEGKPNA